MKKIILTLLLMFGISSQSHAFLAAALSAASGPGAVFVLYMSVGVLQVTVATTTDNPMFFISAALFSGDDKSKTLGSISVAEDISALASAGIYSHAEAGLLKAELKAFEEANKSISVNLDQVKGTSPAEIVATIQTEVGTSRLLAEYIVNKMGIQTN